MKKHLILLLLFSLLSCSKGQVSDTGRITALEQALGVTVSDSPVVGKGLFFEGVTYGSASRNQLDILLPSEQAISGVFIFFHPGSFLDGDKSFVFDASFEATVQSLLEANVAMVSANYTFLTTPGSEGVLSALEDGAEVVSFIKNLAPSLLLPPNKIVLAGASAGAGIAQWNGFRNTSNSDVQGVVALEAQSSYNLYSWERVFPGFSVDEIRQQYPVLETVYNQFYGGNPTEELLERLDYRAAIDGNDPPLYLYNQNSGQEVFNAEGALDLDVLFHSFRHTDYLRLKAIEEGLEFSGAYQEAPDAFVLRMLR